MRILFFARNTIHHASPGGMEVAFDSLATALRDLGVSVALVTTSGFHQADSSPHQFEAVWQVPGTRAGRYSRTWWRATGARGPWDTWQADAVIGIGDAGGGFLGRRDHSVPTIVYSHGTPLMEARSALATRTLRGAAQALLNLLRYPSRRSFYRSADEVWCVGTHIAAEVRRMRRGHRPDTTRFMPNAIDARRLGFDAQRRIELRRELGLHEHERVGLYLGRVERQKGVGEALDLIRGDDPPLDRLIIAGQGPDVTRLERIVRARDLGARVLFLGSVGRASVPQLLACADVGILLTRRVEGLPMVILEYAAAGLPMLTTKSAGVPEDIGSAVRVSIARSRGARPEAARRLANPFTSRRSYLPPRYELSKFGDRHLVRLTDVIGTT